MTASTRSASDLRASDRVVLRVLSVIAAATAIAALALGTLFTVLRAADLGLPYELRTSTARDLDDPRVVWAEYSQTQLVTHGMSPSVQILLAVGLATATIMIASTAGAIAYFLHRLTAGQPFHRSFYRLAIFVGMVLSFGGLISGAATGLGSMIAADELNQTTPHGFVVGFAFDLTPIFVGLVVVALAFVFRAGARLQRDTEGLV